MSSSFKNIVSILVLVTLIFVAYFTIFSKPQEDEMSIGSSSIPPELYNSTQLFIKHTQDLDKVKINTGIFEDNNFNSYVSFSKSIVNQPTGRNNPFATPTKSNIATEE